MNDRDASERKRERERGITFLSSSTASSFISQRFDIFLSRSALKIEGFQDRLGSVSSAR